MPSGFRIQNLSIEGFKGFTTRREIDLMGRHMFLLGQNGNGKSSIVEAIRWGLFGSTGRRNEVVANRGYSVRCRVEIGLIRAGEQFNFRRTLIQGASGGSDPILTDATGQERLIREVMPQLDSVEAGEGMHIILAPQAVPLRRQPEDLSSFERTVLRQLGLINPRALLSQLDDFVLSQQLVEDKLGEQLTDARSNIDRQISDLEQRRSGILASPPWRNDLAPTVLESENRVRDLIAEITGQPPYDSLSGASLDALIETAEDCLVAKRNQDQGLLTAEERELRERSGFLEEYKENLAEVVESRSRLQTLQGRIDSVLSGMSIEELQSRVLQLREAADIAGLKHTLVENAVSLMSQVRDEFVECPVCEAEHDRNTLELSLKRLLHEFPNNSSSDLPQFQDRLEQVQELENEARQLSENLKGLEKTCEEMKGDVSNGDKKGVTDAVVPDDIQVIITRISEWADGVKAQIADQESWFTSLEWPISSF